MLKGRESLLDCDQFDSVVLSKNNEELTLKKRIMKSLLKNNLLFLIIIYCFPFAVFLYSLASCRWLKIYSDQGLHNI